MKSIALPTCALLLASLTACYPLQHADPIVDPVTLGGTSVQRGELLYNAHCYKCHTDGLGGLGSSLNDKPLPRFAIRLQIRQGLGVMPAFGEQTLTDRQVEDIIDYVIALRVQDRIRR